MLVCEGCDGAAAAVGLCWPLVLATCVCAHACAYACALYACTWASMRASTDLWSAVASGLWCLRC